MVVRAFTLGPQGPLEGQHGDAYPQRAKHHQVGLTEEGKYDQLV